MLELALTNSPLWPANCPFLLDDRHLGLDYLNDDITTGTGALWQSFGGCARSRPGSAPVPGKDSWAWAGPSVWTCTLCALGLELKSGT